MSIENNVPDGTFVKEIAGLVHPVPQLQRLADGRFVHMAGAQHKIIESLLMPEPKTLEVSTLAAIVTACKMGHCGGAVIHVVSPTEVRLVEPVVGDQRQQFVYVQSKANVPTTNWGQFRPVEDFIVGLLTNCENTAERARTLDYAASLSSGLASAIEDNGATQSVTTKRGITRTNGPAQFANPVVLSPFRTFAEVSQPYSPFVLRLKQSANEAEMSAIAALFEADGGAWRVQAIANIGEWLRERLPEATILA